jgi:hypothetical protein
MAVFSGCGSEKGQSICLNSHAAFCLLKPRRKKTCEQFKIRFLPGANKVVGGKDKVTLMSYEKCQRFAIAFFSSFGCRLTKERRINFPLNNFQFPLVFCFSVLFFLDFLYF